MTPGMQRPRQPIRNQRGYAYMLVMFLLALLIVSTMSAVPNVLIQGRREREEEMIWRGNQYKRAIRLYVSHRTNASHRLPTSLEDLTKGKPGVHFLRQAYKDPMNKKDGSWRLIYVGPSGQLIGSTRPHPQNLIIPGMNAGPPSAGPLQNQAGSNPNGLLSLSSQSSPGGTTSASGSQARTQESSDTGASLSPPPEVPPDGVTLVGGNIIGIGSKVNQKSVMWFEKAKNYREFEFIWDPAKDVAVAAQQGAGPAPAQGGGLSNPFVLPDGSIIPPTNGP
ncbi:MAG TPA: hypothetical protein VN982_06810 [Candidatus Dormibacteraeota bacterium]|nr:hypothetical protein [Candidatus Dormibacteraeota bacterium]